MDKAYYWYRPHPFFGKFYPGRMLGLISHEEIFSRYRLDPALIKKYFPDGLTPHGLSMMLSQQFRESVVAEPIIELTFELVRQLHYPNAPSRLTSLYASKTLSQAEQWRKTWLKNFGNSQVDTAQSLWEIQFEADAKLYDAAYLNVPPDAGFSYLMQLEHAHKYWSGTFSEDPLPELLVPLPATIIRKIRDNVSE